MASIEKTTIQIKIFKKQSALSTLLTLQNVNNVESASLNSKENDSI